MKRFFKQKTIAAFFDILNSDETLRIHSAQEIFTQQLIKNSRSGIKPVKEKLFTKLVEGPR